MVLSDPELFQRFPALSAARRRWVGVRGAATVSGPERGVSRSAHLASASSLVSPADSDGFELDPTAVGARDAVGDPAQDAAEGDRPTATAGGQPTSRLTQAD